mmetsp:Transcript_15405/g.31143  ORF Transcript_15405/g.31143 Transcript_15405/m.31143 type:complete len:142 (+) Transcript_15405:95-520(+)
MTTRNETNEGIDVNEGIAHRMVRCVGRAVNSFLAPSDTVRKLDILIEEAKEEDKFLEKETEHLRKVDDYLLSELKARGLTYPPLASELKARGLTYVPPANATIVDVLEEMADLLNAERQRSERCSQSRCRCGAVVDNSDSK